MPCPGMSRLPGPSGPRDPHPQGPTEGIDPSGSTAAPIPGHGPAGVHRDTDTGGGGVGGTDPPAGRSGAPSPSPSPPTTTTPTPPGGQLHLRTPDGGGSSPAYCSTRTSPRGHFVPIAGEFIVKTARPGEMR